MRTSSVHYTRVLHPLHVKYTNLFVFIGNYLTVKYKRIKVLISYFHVKEFLINI